MIPLSLAEVAAAVGGRLDRADPATSLTGPVVIDSRDATAGSLFVALRGTRTDGHDHAAAAVAAGAVAVLAGRVVGVPAVVVPDVVPALGRLARAVLDRLPSLTVVGVTGSSGKTGTKDLLAALLDRLGPTVAPVGSYNNEIGHPLTALRCEAATRFLVAECSARGRGHIAALCRIAPPRIGVELNVGTAHLGEFGSREAIAASKAELVEALPADGLAVLNADDPLVLAMAGRTSARVRTFGRSAAADVRADKVSVDDLARPSFELRTPAGSAAVDLRLHGEHHVGNALAAAAAAIELGLPLEDAAAALSAATPVSRWRMEVHARPDGTIVINDAYNANPESVRAALQTLGTMARGRRSWAVLGEMAELGPAADAEHELLGRLAVRLGVSRLVAVGPRAGRVLAGAVLEGSCAGESAHVRDAAAAVALLTREVGPGDVVLVKGSRTAGLERVAAALLPAEPGVPVEPAVLVEPAKAAEPA